MSEATSMTLFDAAARRFSGTEENPLQDLLGILRRRRWSIILSTIGLAAFPALYGVTLPQKYTATASLVVQPQENRIINLDQVQPARPSDFGVTGAEREVIRSRDLLTRVMTQLHLFDDSEYHPELNPSPPTKLQAYASKATEWLFRRIEASSAELLDESSGAKNLVVSDDYRDTALTTFASMLEIDQTQDSNVLRVSFTSTDPVKAAVVVNSLTKSYLDTRLLAKLNATRKANTWLNDQLVAMQEEVIALEQKAAQFRSNNQLNPTDNSTLAGLKLSELQRELNEIQAEKAAQEAKLGATERAGGLDTIKDVLESPVIVTLRQQESDFIRRDAELASEFGIRHPRRVAAQQEREKLEERIRAEVGRIVQGIRNDIVVLAHREAIVKRQLEEASAAVGQENQADVHLREINREAAAKRTLYEELLTRYQVTSSQEGILEPDASLISMADVPSMPSSPSPTLFVGVGFTVAAVLSLMLAVVQDQLDKRLRTRAQIERGLGVRCLGYIPIVRRRSRKAVCYYLMTRPRSAFTQAIRGLYLDVTRNAERQVVLVTSALPEEGKTSLATSLAVCAAQIDNKDTLLVDFDLWRSGIARDLKLEPKSGLAEALENGDMAASIQRCVIKDHSLGISVLAASKYDSDMVRLCSSPIAELIGYIRQQYECVIIDSPPLLGIHDARILAAYSDVTIVAARWNKTERDALEAALRVLQDVAANVVGVVLNLVDVRKHSRDAHSDGVQYYKYLKKYYVE